MNNKKISLESLEKIYNSTKEYHSAVLKTGEILNYKMKFSYTDIEALIKELGSALIEDEEKELNFFKSEQYLFYYTYFLIIKYFTELGDEFKDSLEENIPLFEMLLETSLYTEILEILPREEIGEVVEEIVKRNEKILELMNEELRAQIKVEELSKKE